MREKTLLKQTSLYLIIITILCSMAMFLGVNVTNKVSADTTTYTVTFYQENYGFENVVFTVNAGESLNPSQIPQVPEASGVYEYVWLNINAIQNVNSNVTVTLYQRINPSLMHTVTFVFPDGTTKSVQVLHGDDITNPPTSDNLGFGEKDSYSVTLTNVTSDMEVKVTIDKTMKYLTIALCGAVLVAGLVVCVFVVIKMINSSNNNSNNPNKVVENSNSEK